MKKLPIKLRINAVDGSVTSIYSDASLPLLRSLVVDPRDVIRSVKRASNVEPHPGGGWAADLSLVGGPLLLDKDNIPFQTRDQAIQAEIAWLDANIISVKSQEK